MKIKKMGWFLSLFPIAGITLAPFGIYIKENYLMNKFVINHESIHWKQQMEMLIIFFYILYLIEWIIKTFIYGEKAYVNLSSEREAYAYEHNLNYLKTRKHYAWLKYIFKKA